MSRMAAKLRAPTSISEVMASGRTEHGNRQLQHTWLSSPPGLSCNSGSSSGFGDARQQQDLVSNNLLKPKTINQQDLVSDVCSLSQICFFF
nr:hypothetical protein Iba_chr13dCG6740 [Ipomoea batatas]